MHNAPTLLDKAILAILVLHIDLEFQFLMSSQLRLLVIGEQCLEVFQVVRQQLGAHSIERRCCLAKQIEIHGVVLDAAQRHHEIGILGLRRKGCNNIKKIQ